MLQPQRREHWRRNLRLTSVLLLLWFIATFGVAWFAAELSAIDFFGWPLGFYMAAQGSLIIYCLIVLYYAWRMRRLDAEHGMAGQDGGDG